MRVFITGSTGLLGGNLARLLLQQGHQVKALARDASKAARLLPEQTEVVVGDLGDVPAFAAHLKGCDALVHCAAFFREYFQHGDHQAILHRYNVEATLELLEAARTHGLEHFVQVSSSGTIGPKAGHQPGDEDTPPSRLSLSNLYFRSKVECDHRLAQYPHRDKIRISTVLPGWMWGPGDAAPTGAGQMALDFLAGKLPAVPPGGTSLVDARDVALGILRILESPRPSNRYIVGGRRTSLRQVVDGLARASGRRSPRWNLPYPVAYLVAWLSEMTARLSGKPTSITREGVRTLADFHTVDSSRAERELQIKFRPLGETLQDTVTSLQVLHPGG